MTDWYVVLEARGDGPSGVLEIVAGDERDAILTMELWAEGISQLGYVPRSALDWQNETPCAVLGRASRRRFRVRCDGLERETDHGVTSGAGWLLIREAGTA
jgi:hypothetical protein